MSDATMTLRCTACKVEDTRPLEECATGDEAPTCKQCGGVMFALSVQARMPEDPDLMRAFGRRAKDYLDWFADPRPSELVDDDDE